jgi:pseudouridine-5'-phosphate glycosidase
MGYTTTLKYNISQDLEPLSSFRTVMIAQQMKCLLGMETTII